MAAVHIYIGLIHIAVGDVTAAKCIAGILDGILGGILAQTRVIKFFDIAFIEVGSLCIVGFAGGIAVADIAIVDGQM